MTSALDPALYELTALTETLTGVLTADTPTVRRRRRARAQRFAKGPIPIAWLKACSRASPRAFQLACVILMRTGRAIRNEDQVEIAVTQAVGNDAELSRDQRRDAVLARSRSRGASRNRRSPPQPCVPGTAEALA